MLIPPPWRRRTPTTVRGALVQFFATGLIALVIIGAIAFVALRRESEQEAIRDARALTEVIAHSIVEPTLVELPGVIDGEPEAIREFDRRMRARVLGQEVPIVRMKLWRRDGRIVYSDLRGLTGNTYEFDEGHGSDFTSVRAEVTKLDRAENEFDQLSGHLLEVYVPIRAHDGRALLFETYQRFSTVRSGSTAVFERFLPIFLIALIVLSLVQAPLALSLARRLRQGQREREELLQSAIEASDRERRRIASDLHDGPVQELAGLSFALAGAADRTPPGLGAARERLGESAAATRRIMRQLRSMLVEIHPQNLHASGLESALSDLLAPLGSKGIETSLTVDGLSRLTPEAEALLYRGAQEAVRNAVAHSGARSIHVSVGSDNGVVQLEVRDDGRGFDAADRERRRSEGHLGLDLLQDLVSHAGGRVDIESAPRHGTRMAIRIPLG